jgi:hypothetical protein
MIRALRFHPGTVVVKLGLGWFFGMVDGSLHQFSSVCVCVCGDDDSLLRAPRTALLIYSCCDGTLKRERLRQQRLKL